MDEALEGERRINSLMAIGMAVSRVETKVDLLDKKMDDHIKDDDKRFDKISLDTDSIKRNIWLAAGGGSVVVWLIVNFWPQH